MAHLLVNYNRLIYCKCQGKSRNSEGSHETGCSHDKDAGKSAMGEFHGERKHTLILLLMQMRLLFDAEYPKKWRTCINKRCMLCRRVPW
jgi:hypothetical protein